MTPTERLAQARLVLAWVPPPSGARGAVFLARQALEDGVCQVLDAPPRQLRWLMRAHELSRGGHALRLWNELSLACHAHGQEIAPRVGLVARWIDEVEEVLR